ncbi:MAG: NAD-dependent epimerase/dehydratase family protein [Candidatus Hodarchaeales archaeon]|jgi:nucleoside-diphosphate-sugar epimerase
MFNNILVTGASGFIGRWVVKEFLKKGISIIGIDNFSNSTKNNIQEFLDNPNFTFMKADVRKLNELIPIFSNNSFDAIIHLAAQINVQESLDYPNLSYDNNVKGTYNLLELARTNNKPRFVIIGTCMVYDVANANKPISEIHPVKPRSPYAGSKLAAEYLAESYYYSYNLPVVILRPFNTYGPYQKINMEGGVVSIFVKRSLEGKDLLIFGTGEQTRDFLYVEDCANFVVKASLNEKSIGHVLNAGTGVDITIKDLATKISNGKIPIRHIKHHHPQSEIMKLVCDPKKAQELLNWKPHYSLDHGISNLRKWLKGEKSVN